MAIESVQGPNTLAQAQGGAQQNSPLKGDQVVDQDKAISKNISGPEEQKTSPPQQSDKGVGGKIDTSA